MLTFQDFQKSKDKEEFIKLAIDEYVCSKRYKDAVVSRLYYEGNNAILNRLQYFFNSLGTKEVDKFKANNTISNNFYKKIVMQEKSYLLANGVQLEDKYKGKIKKLDVKMLEGGLNGLLDGIAYGYCYKGKKGDFKISCFKGVEFCPLHDEKTADLMAGIRFYQLASDKPMFVELYEIDGMTEYEIKENKITKTVEKRSYSTVKETDILGTRIVGGNNWSELPIVEFKANEEGAPILSYSLKTKMDLYDIILSDFGNNLEDSNDVYWVLNNYAGQGMDEFLAEFKYHKVVQTDSEGSADMKTVDVPYQARQVALEILRAKIYEEAMAVDMSILSGGSLTATHIKASMSDLDLKTDDFELQMIDTVDDILELYDEFVNGIGKEVDEDHQVDFIRRTLVNDTETIDNIYKFREDIDLETALELNPMIDNRNIKAIIAKKEKEGSNWEMDKQGEV